jgi:hypothetical protein
MLKNSRVHNYVKGTGAHRAPLQCGQSNLFTPSYDRAPPEAWRETRGHRPRLRRPTRESGEWCRLLLAVQHFSQGPVDFYSAVVADESLFPESVHEEIDSRTGSADHLRQNLVIYSGQFGN